MGFFEQAMHTREPRKISSFLRGPLDKSFSNLKTILELKQWTNRNQEFTQ
jgi:hypothetical protein